MFQEVRIYSDYLEKKTKSPKNLYDETFENYEITKLDIRRIYRYLDKNIKKENLDDDLDEVDDI